MLWRRLSEALDAPFKRQAPIKLAGKRGYFFSWSFRLCGMQLVCCPSSRRTRNRVELAPTAVFPRQFFWGVPAACNPTAAFVRFRSPLSSFFFMLVTGGVRYMLGMLSSVLEEVEGAFDGYQFYKASQVRGERERLVPHASTHGRGLATRRSNEQSGRRHRGHHFFFVLPGVIYLRINSTAVVVGKCPPVVPPNVSPSAIQTSTHQYNT